jgi:Flp pilus assembly protein TadD
LIDLRIDDHADPVGEMSRQLAYLRAHQRADQAVAKASAGDLSNALTELDACCEQFPREPEFLTRRALVLLGLGRAGEARQTMERACAIHPGWAEFAWRFANAGIVSIPLERMEGVVAGLRPQQGKRG